MPQVTLYEDSAIAPIKLPSKNQDVRLSFPRESEAAECEPQVDAGLRDFEAAQLSENWFETLKEGGNKELGTVPLEFERSRAFKPGRAQPREGETHC